jgi:hypothetical protein
MPGVSLSGDVFRLSGAGGFDWGPAAARGNGFAVLSLDLEAEACHGLDLAAAGDARLQLGGVVSLLAQIRGEAAALARAGARLQIGLKPDLFDKMGLTVEASAYAEAALAVSLGLGLDVEEIARVASRILGGDGSPAFQLFRIFLEGVELEAGAWARLSASAAASAYVNVAGTLTGDTPGFAIEAGASAGASAGAGYDFYARYGIKDPQRMIARGADVVSRWALRQIPVLVPDTPRPALEPADLLIPFAIRVCFELGRAQTLQQLGREPEVIKSFVAGFAAELQRFSLERAALAVTRVVGDILERFLRFAGASNDLTGPRRDAALAAARGLRTALKDGHLGPEDASAVVDALLALLDAIGDERLPGLRRLVSILWACSALGYAARGVLERTGGSQSWSASLIGVGPVSGGGTNFALLPVPAGVRAEIARALGLPARTAIAPEHLARYVSDAGLEPLLLQHAPEAAAAIDQARDALGLDPVDFFSALLPGGEGAAGGASAAYARVRAWVGAQIDGIVLGQVVDPAIAKARAGRNGEAADLLETIVHPACVGLRDSLLVALDEVAQGRPLSADFASTCSAIAFKIIAPGLATISSVLAGFVAENASDGLKAVARRLDGPNGPAIAAAAAQVFVPILPHSTGFIGGGTEATRILLVDLCGIGAEMTGPRILSRERREEQRKLLADLLLSIDGHVDWSSPEAARAGMRELAECAFIPNRSLLEKQFALTASILTEQTELVAERAPAALAKFFAALALPAIREAEKGLADTLLTFDQALERLAAQLSALQAEIARHLAEAERLLRQGEAALADAAARMRARATLDNLVRELRAEAASRARQSLPRGTPAPVVETAVRAAVLAFDNSATRELLKVALGAVAPAAGALGDILREARGATAALREITRRLTARIAGPLRDFSVSGTGLGDVVATIVSLIDTPEWRQAADTHLKAVDARARTMALHARAVEARGKIVEEQQETRRERDEAGRSGPCAIQITSPQPFDRRQAAATAASADLRLDLAVSGRVTQKFFLLGKRRRVLLYLNGVALKYAPADWAPGPNGAFAYRKDVPLATLPIRVGLNTLEVVVTQPGGAAPARSAATFLHSPPQGTRPDLPVLVPGGWSGPPRITRIRIPR